MENRKTTMEVNLDESFISTSSSTSTIKAEDLSSSTLNDFNENEEKMDERVAMQDAKLSSTTTILLNKRLLRVVSCYFYFYYNYLNHESFNCSCLNKIKIQIYFVNKLVREREWLLYIKISLKSTHNMYKA